MTGLNYSPFGASLEHAHSRLAMWKDPRVLFPVVTALSAIANLAIIAQAIGLL